jgi:hypothetical protein
MDDLWFDNFIRSLSESRRTFLGGALAAASWLGAPALEAKKKKRRKRKHDKRKKPQPNAYGCLNVGQPCNGDSTLCCSGICDGTKPKERKPDRSRCLAHDAGICTVESDVCTTGQDAICNIQNPCCQCYRTTGDAPFCGDVSAGLLNLCRDCRQDTECEGEFGPGAACIALGGICAAVCPSTGGTVCMPVCPEA